MYELDEFYENIQSLTPGESTTYEGYTLKKVELKGIVSPPDHSEVGVYTESGTKIESLTLGAMDYTRFKSILDEIADEQPNTMDDWLNR